LLNILAAMPRTLVHGDFKAANLGILGEGKTSRTVLFDWQDATFGAPFLDLGYFLSVNARRLPCTHDEALGIYTDALVRRGLKFDARERDLGLVAGGALRLLWQMALSAQGPDMA